MAEQLLDAVERLQSRLSETVEPKKILKTLRRLGELPMTVEILVDTGVGKTVNSFRKHELAGEVAKDLVAKWKKLVPQPSADRPSISHSKEPLRSHGPPRAHHDAGAGGHRRPRLPSPQPRGEEEEEEQEQEQEQEEPSYMEMEEEEEEMMTTTIEEEHEEERGYSRGYSPSPPPRHHHHHQQQQQQQQHERYSPQPRGGGYRSEEYDDSPPHSPPPVSPSPPPPPPARSKDAGRHGKQHKEPGKNPNQQPQARGSHGDRRDRERGGAERQQKKRAAPEAEPAPGGGAKPAKHGRHNAAHEGKREKERGEREDKKKGSDVRPKEPAAAAAEEDEFETPTMSFESFLMYDAPTPTKKKKKPSSSSSSSHSRPSHPSSSSSSSHARTQPAAAAAASSSSSSSSSSKPSKSNGTKSSKRSEVVSAPVAVTPEKRRRVVEVVPALPDFPLPAIQPNYRPLPSLDPMPLSPQRRKVPQPNGEDEGFTGKRFNSKMMVYSGTKTANLPKMMTLYEQCIRVLQNNIDSIDEVGGVPFEILEPVLERCTPEQLYRIEECNRCFMEDSDELWSRHCQRDFKRASPQEYESWREMYLRLHYEREERLRMLTQNISSAHANKPKGRQVKMAFVNSVAKPPRDVRRRQEKFGTISTSTASSAAAAAPIKIRPATSYSNPGDAGQFSSSSSSLPQGSPPQGSFRSSLGGGAAAGGGAAGRDKPQVKKIAPMMAKTIKAFKNRFSRR